MTLTPKSVQLGPESDEELVIVVCETEKGHPQNHYIRDAELRTSLGKLQADTTAERSLTQQRHADEITQLANRQGAEKVELNAKIEKAFSEAHAPVLTRATTEIDEAARKAVEAAAAR